MTTLLFQTIQFSMSTQFNCQKRFYFKLFSLTVKTVVIQFSINTDFVYTQLNVKTIQFSGSKVSMSKTVPFQTIQLSISTQFKCKYTVYLSKHFYFKPLRPVKQFQLKQFSLA